MKKIKKLFIVLLAAAMLCGVIVGLTACGGGFKVTYALPDGATGTLPASATYAQYDEFELPAVADASMPHMEQIGWKDSEGNYYGNGETFTMGGFDITLTAVFRGKEILVSYCENAANMVMAGKGDLGPSPAYTHFYADKTWTASALGKYFYSEFSGTWDLSAAGELTMKLVEQDGIIVNETVEVDTNDDRCYSWTLSHLTATMGAKYHKNHMSRYAFLSSYNAEFGTSLTVPAEPMFTMTFNGNGNAAAPAVGDAPTAVTVKAGQSITMPTNPFTREGYTFSGWQVIDSDKVTVQAGTAYTMVMWDLTVNAVWTKA